MAKSPSKKKGGGTSMGRTYLGLYNLCQLGLWMTVMSFTVKCMVEEPGDFACIWSNAGKYVKFAVSLAWMEVIHTMIGLSRGSPLSAFLQIFGRWFIIFALLNSFTTAQGKYLPHLFLAWSSIELIRYPYYLLADFAAAPEWLTWLRYSAFIPLYPLGIFAEYMVCISSLDEVKKAVEMTGKYCFPMPGNAYPNVNLFNFYYFLLFGMYVLYPLGGPGLYYYMFKQRSKRLGGGGGRKKASSSSSSSSSISAEERPRTRSAAAKSRKAD